MALANLTQKKRHSLKLIFDKKSQSKHGSRTRICHINCSAHLDYRFLKKMPFLIRLFPFYIRLNGFKNKIKPVLSIFKNTK